MIYSTSFFLDSKTALTPKDHFKVFYENNRGSLRGWDQELVQDGGCYRHWTESRRVNTGNGSGKYTRKDSFSLLADVRCLRCKLAMLYSTLSLRCCWVMWLGDEAKGKIAVQVFAWPHVVEGKWICDHDPLWSCCTQCTTTVFDSKLLKSSKSTWWFINQYVLYLTCYISDCHATNALMSGPV